MVAARLAGVEMFKLRKRPLTWILLSILVLIVVVVYVLLWAVTETITESAAEAPFGPPTDIETLKETLYLRQAVPFGLEITRGVGTFLAVILAAGSIGGEYGWDTVRPYLTAASSRRAFMAGHALAVALLMLMGTLVGMVTALVSSALVSAIAGGINYSFVDAAYVGESLLSYGRTLLAMAPYLAMAVFFAIWGRSTMAGIGASLGVLFLEAIITSLMQLAGGTAADLANLFPGVNADTLMHENDLALTLQMERERPLDIPVLDPPLAAGVLVAYALAFLVAAFILFDRRDVRA